VIGQADYAVRLAAFDWLSQEREINGEALSRSSLVGFEFSGRSVPLVGPSGIWKPAACELPISVTTVLNGPYDDAMNEASRSVEYAYRGTDPAHRDNRGLRRAMNERVPLIYFYGIERGKYVAAYPTFVVADDPTGLHFSLQVDDIGAALAAGAPENAYPQADPELRRAYITASVQRRVHQVAFRERVLRAYEQQCALCRLRHRELLDAAHITPDRDEQGDPSVQNGLALCKLHHAAYDRLFFAVRPDYRVEVRPSILIESDGPMLIVGLQQINGQMIHIPSRTFEQPDRDRLDRRYQEFRAVSAA
jgi:putative restriction endonuclease